MRIAHVVCVFPPYRGGIGKAAHDLALAQAQLGHEVTVFTPQYKDRDFFSGEPGLVLRTLRPIFSFGNAAALPQILWKLSKYDVVHLHYPFFGTALFVALGKILLRKRIKLVIRYHMDVVGRGVIGLFFSLHAKMMAPCILRCADRILVSSEDYLRASRLRHVFEKLRDRVEIIPFGVDTKRFVPGDKDPHLLARHGLSSHTRIILFVGGLDSAHYFKGLEILIRACAKLTRHTTPEFALLIIGQHGDLEDHYKKMIATVGLERRIIIAGTVSDSELVKYYQTCDVFVLPSLDRSEAFGIVYLEAGSCGKPVIGTDLAGVRTVIRHGHDGYVVPPRDVDALAQRILYLVTEKHVAEKFGMNGRKKVLDNYQWDKIAPDILRIYESI